MKRWIGAVVVLGGMILWGLFGGRSDDPAIVALPGYPVYKEHCRKCHGGAGDGPKASRMAKRTVDLAAPAFRDTVTAAWITRVVRDGRGRMKPLDDRLRPGEIDTVAAFVLSLPVRD